MTTAQARPSSLEPAADASVTWRYIAPVGHTKEMCENPDYWRLNIRDLGRQRTIGRHAWNRLEVIAEDGSWEAEYRVTAVNGDQVTLRCLREWAPEARPGRKPALPDRYRLEYVQGNGWRIIDHTGTIAGAGYTTEEEALRVAVAHGRRAAA